MLLLQHGKLLFPARSVDSFALEPVTALESKGAARKSDEPSPRHMLPIGNVYDQLPDVVASFFRTPRCSFRIDPPQRRAHGGTLPAVLVVGLVHQPEKKIDVFHRREDPLDVNTLVRRS